MTDLTNIVHSTSGLDSPTTDSGQCFKLAILNPLNDSQMLAACRDPSTRFIICCDGSILRRANYETLNLYPLGQAWRKAIIDLPPPYEVTFDLTMTKKEMTPPPAKNEKLYWEDTGPRSEADAGLTIVTQHVMNLVIDLATAMRMRAKGDLSFKITSYDDEPGRSFPRWRLLRKQLDALEKCRSSKQDA